MTKSDSVKLSGCLFPIQILLFVATFGIFWAILAISTPQHPNAGKLSPVWMDNLLLLEMAMGVVLVSGIGVHLLRRWMRRRGC